MTSRKYEYNKTARIYERRLAAIGYTVKYNWSGYGAYGMYTDVTVRGPRWCGYGGEFPTPRHAYKYLCATRL